MVKIGWKLLQLESGNEKCDRRTDRPTDGLTDGQCNHYMPPYEGIKNNMDSLQRATGLKRLSKDKEWQEQKFSHNQGQLLYNSYI